MTGINQGQVPALRELYRPPDPKHDDAPPVTRRGVEEVQTQGPGLQQEPTTPMHDWIGVLPTVAAEARIVLELAREIWLLGGLHPDEGVRLKLAVERLERALALIEAEFDKRAKARK